MTLNFFFHRWILIFFIAFSGGVQAQTRLLTLYPDQEIAIVEKSKESPHWRLSLTESFFSPEQFPCLFEMNHIPMLYGAYQGGLSCAFQTSPGNSWSLDVLPEWNGQEGNASSWSAVMGVGYTHDLSHGQGRWLLHTDLRYKYWTKDLSEVSGVIPTKELIQLWGNVFDSNMSLGVVYRPHSEQNNTVSNFSAYFFYTQSVPLALRGVGGLEKTASLEYKYVGASFRKKVGAVFAYGFGLAYWNLTFDGIQFSAPLPTLYLSLDM